MTSVRPAASAAPGQWLLEVPAPWWDLVRFGPPGYDVHLRIRFADDPVDTADAADEAAGSAERAALAVLAGHTATPQDCWAAVWEGWTNLGTVPDAPRVPVPNREVLLFRSHVDDLDDLPSVAWRQDGWSWGPAPHLAWPADRSWVFACDVDEEVAFSVACDEAAAAALVEVFGARARAARYGEDLTHEHDGR